MLRNYKFSQTLYLMIMIILILVNSIAIAFAAEKKVNIDVSKANDGYISINYIGKKSTPPRMKVVLQLGQDKYTYDLNRGLTTDNFPLQLGNGKYTIQVFENVTGNKYGLLESVDVTVKLTNELSPFLVPTQLINYSKNDQAILKSTELVSSAKTAEEKVSAIYSYITATIKYDNDKAQDVATGAISGTYVPSIDDTLSKKKGICFDYSSLMAAMLRSQGVPTRLVMGYVAPDNLYHAWNEVYLEGKGWVEIAKLNFPGKSWERMDSTFGAGSNNASDVLAKVNTKDYYQTRYVY